MTQADIPALTSPIWRACNPEGPRRTALTRTIRESTAKRSSSHHVRDTHYVNIEDAMGQRSRHQAEVGRGRGRGRQLTSEEVECRINWTEDAVMMMLYFDVANGPRLDQRYDASTTPMKLLMNAVVMSDLREMVVDAAGGKSLITVGGHVGEEYETNLLQDEGNLKGIVMTVTLMMNCMAMTVRRG